MASQFAVGFDLDHTLVVDNRLERTVALELLAQYAREHGASYDAAKAESAVEEMLAGYRSGSMTPEIGIAAFLGRFVSVAGQANMDAAAHFRERVMARASEFIAPIEGARELLAALVERGVAIAVLSNGWSPFQEEKARLIGFSGPVLVSERIGVRKPAPEAFAFLADHFERAAVDILYVGDDPESDCAGASAASMRAVWFDWEDRAYPSDLAAPYATIRRLTDLLEILQGRD